MPKMEKSRGRQRLLLLLPILLWFCFASRAGAVTLVRCQDMADLRSKAGGGEIIARLIRDTPVTVLETSGKWSRITAGDGGAALEGWIASADLGEEDEEALEYLMIGDDAFPIAPSDRIQLLAEPREDAQVLGAFEQDSEYSLCTVGVLRDDAWLLCIVKEEETPVFWGFVPSGQVRTFMSGQLLADKANAAVNLRRTASKNGRVVGAYYSGAQVDILFGFENTVGWRRVGIGGVTGYMPDRNIETDAADGIPYRSPLLGLRGESAVLYAAPAGTDTADPGVLTGENAFCILGKCEKRYHVRVETSEYGVWKYGFVNVDDLEKAKPVCGNLDATLSADTLLFGSGEDDVPHLKKGQKVRILSFYQEKPDQEGARALDYDRPGVSWAWINVFLDTGLGYKEPFSGYIPIESLKLDPHLVLPVSMDPVD